MEKQYTFVTKFLPVDFEGTLYNSVCHLLSLKFPWIRSPTYVMQAKLIPFRKWILDAVWCKSPAS